MGEPEVPGGGGLMWMLIRPFVNIRTIVLASLPLFLSAAVQAAEIEPYSNPIMACTIKISGNIVEGDAERFSALAGEATYDEQRVCFNSPGGSFLEGIRLARAIHDAGFGTAIEEGNVCESACAIAFMAGRRRAIEEEPGRARVLHPRGQLGFHAPGIVFEDRLFERSEVDRAYRIATLAIAQLASLRYEIEFDFPDSLLNQMLSTNPSSMRDVVTVGDAARWRIDVAPAAFYVPEDLRQSIINICTHGFALEPTLRIEYFDRSFPWEPTITVRDNLYIQTELCAGVEGAFCCSGSVDTERSPADFFQHQRHSFQRSFMSHPTNTPLMTIGTDFDSSRRAFISKLREMRQVATPQCWLTAPTARVTNVNEYVNLRRQPDFSAPIIRQVPLSERVKVVNVENIRVIGEGFDRQVCIEACRSFGAMRENRAVMDRA